MIRSINSSSDINFTINRNKDSSNSKSFKNLLDDTLTTFPGMNGLKSDYNYEEMTNTEKKLFNSYLLQKMLISSQKGDETAQNFTYEKFKENVLCFPPPDASKDEFKAWESFLSKYPENEQIKVMAQFIPEAPVNTDSRSYVKSLIDRCTLDEIATGTNRTYEKNLYDSFLKELDNIDSM